MNSIRIAIAVAVAVMLMTVVLFSAGGRDVLAQVTQEGIGFEVAVELAESRTITIPVRFDAATYYGLMSYPTTSAAMQALSQLQNQTLQSLGASTTSSLTISSTASTDLSEPQSGNELLIQTPLHFSSVPFADAKIVVNPLAINGEAGQPTSLVPANEPSVTNANAYQRLNPSIDAAILGQLPAQTEVIVDGRNADGQWLHLADGSWVARFLLDNVPASLPIIVDGTNRGVASATGTITGDSVILRDGPSQANDMVGMYDVGVPVAVLSRASTGDWMEVAMPDGSVGWMSSEFLELQGDVESLPEVITVGDRDIYGAVVDSAGLGVDSVDLHAEPSDGSSDQQLFATSAGDGSFLITVPDNDIDAWSVSVDDIDCASRLMNDRCQLFGYYLATPRIDIELPLDEPVELVYADATSFIAGTVVDGNGAPQGAGITVSAVREDGAVTSGVTASSGKFVLPADAGSWELSTARGPSVTVQVEAGSAPDPIEVPIG